MISTQLGYLDKAYIVLNSNYLIDNDSEVYLRSIEKLAELGQINAIQDFYKLKQPRYCNTMIDGILKSNPSFGETDFEECYALFLHTPSQALADRIIKLANSELGKIFFSDKLKVAILGERVLEMFQAMDELGFPAPMQQVSNFRQMTREELCRLEEVKFPREQAMILKYINAKNYLLKRPITRELSEIKRHFINLLNISQLPLASAGENS